MPFKYLLLRDGRYPAGGWRWTNRELIGDNVRSVKPVVGTIAFTHLLGRIDYQAIVRQVTWKPDREALPGCQPGLDAVFQIVNPD
jgi:hypothetical protein